MAPAQRMHPNVGDVFPGTATDFPTFKALLQQLSLTDALMFCLRVNNIIADWSMEYEDIQKNLARLFFTEDEVKRMFAGTPRIASFKELAITTRGSMTLLARWISMFCEDREGDGETFKNAATRQIFAKAMLIADYIWLQGMQIEKMLNGQSIEDARHNLLCTFRQNAAGSHAPTQHGTMSIGKGYSMFVDPGYFTNQHQEFTEQFQQVTGISIEDYYICLEYVASGQGKIIDGKAFFKFDQAVNSVDAASRSIFAKFLELESQNPAELRKSFWGETRQESLHDFSDAPPLNDRELRTRPFFRTNDGRMMVIDPILFYEKCLDGPLFTLFQVGKAEYFFQQFGYAFEEFVHEYLKQIYPSSEFNDRLSCPLMRQKIGREPGPVELTDGCLDYGDEMVLFEIKATFLRQDKILSNDNEKYVKMLKERYVMTADGEAKGVTQLANTIIGIETGEYQAVGRDFSGVRKIFPVLLVHDELIDAPMHPYFFAKEFVAALKPDEMLPNGFLKKGRFLVAPMTLMTLENIENFEFLIRRKGFSLRDALQRYVELYPDRLQSFHNFCIDAGYQPYAGQIFAQKNLELLEKTKDKLFPK